MTEPFENRPKTPLRPAAAVVAGGLGLSLLLTALALASNSEPLTSSSAALVAAGLVLHGVIGVAGLVLARGQWTRRYAWVLIGGVLIALVVRPWDWWSLGIAGMATLVIGGLSGPWLDGWLRKRPAAVGPGTESVLLLLLAVSAPVVAGAAAWTGADWGDIAYGAGLVVMAWAYGRQISVGWWALRLTVLPLGILAATGDPWPGAAAVLIHASAVTALAWTRAVRIAIKPLMDTLPGPLIASPKDDK
ncbi:MAG: hypothetical protein HKN07_02685 [Acidimicrobiia bacterium]|nr:hypothetical protein [Acidimicrobiia bacterium]